MKIKPAGRCATGRLNRARDKALSNTEREKKVHGEKTVEEGFARKVMWSREKKRKSGLESPKRGTK